MVLSTHRNGLAEEWLAWEEDSKRMFDESARLNKEGSRLQGVKGPEQIQYIQELKNMRTEGERLDLFGRKNLLRARIYDWFHKHAWLMQAANLRFESVEGHERLVEQSDYNSYF